MNNIIIFGRPTTDIEEKQSTSGKTVVSFTLAVPKNFNRDEANFIPVVAWDKLAELLAKYAKKGQQIAIQGELTSRKYEDKQGNKRTAYEVVASNFELCGTKADGVTNNNTTPYMPSAYRPSQTSQTTLEDIIADQDLPF